VVRDNNSVKIKKVSFSGPHSSVTLYQGDCLKILPRLGKVDAVITDPPYGTGKYEHDNDKTVTQCLRSWVRKAVFGYPEILVRWCKVFDNLPDEWVTWWPPNKCGARNKKIPRESEAIGIWGPLYEFPMRRRTQDKWARKVAISRGLDPDWAKEGDVWQEASPGMSCNRHQRRHPNEKPVNLMCKLVRLCSVADETILDPYMGSGTTGVACLRTSRNFIGIEIDSIHFETAVRRLKKEASKGNFGL